MNHNDPARVMFRELYSNSCIKEKLYQQYYPSTKKGICRKWIFAICRKLQIPKESTKRIITGFLTNHKENSSQNQDYNRSLPQYPYLKLLVIARQILPDESSRELFEAELMKRAMALILELRVSHLNL